MAENRKLHFSSVEGRLRWRNRAGGGLFTKKTGDRGRTAETWFAWAGIIRRGEHRGFLHGSAARGGLTWTGARIWSIDGTEGDSTEGRASTAAALLATSRAGPGALRLPDALDAEKSLRRAARSVKEEASRREIDRCTVTAARVVARAEATLQEGDATASMHVLGVRIVVLST